jgi:hypothetical protein
MNELLVTECATEHLPTNCDRELLDHWALPCDGVAEHMAIRAQVAPGSSIALLALTTHGYMHQQTLKQ